MCISINIIVITDLIVNCHQSNHYAVGINHHVENIDSVDQNPVCCLCHFGDDIIVIVNLTTNAPFSTDINHFVQTHLPQKSWFSLFTQGRSEMQLVILGQYI